MKSVLFWSFVAGTIAVLGSVLIINTLMPLMGQEIVSSMYWASLIGSYGIGSPIVFYTLRQNHRLNEALRFLANAEAKLEETNRELAAANDDLEVRVRTDPLTGLVNRATFLVEMHDAVSAYRNNGLLLIDIDDFSHINRTWDHVAGDQALGLVANAVSKTAGPTALTSRLGAEEFAVLFPTNSASEVADRAQAIRDAVSGLVFHPEPSTRHMISVTIGGSVQVEGLTAMDMLRKADQMLRSAKSAGDDMIRLIA